MSPPLAEWLGFVGSHPHYFTIQYPPHREYFMENFRRVPPPAMREGFIDADEILLYLHVPFCEAKCHYCNFAVDLSRDSHIQRSYVDALLSELDSHAEWLLAARVSGVDIGGGTPTHLPMAELARIPNAIRPFLGRATHPFPVSIETTPRIAAEEPEKMESLRAGGVDRVSVGVQSFNAGTLTLVNRRRQIEQTDRAMENLRRAGFARVNLDVIFGLPNQSLEDWALDLEHLITLSPDSITTYDCLYRGAARPISRQTALMPSPQTYGAMYDLAYERLAAGGWRAPYGSVNFCRHPSETGTSAYFEGRLLDGLPYLGLGNYATSMHGAKWSFNVHNLTQYTRRILARENPCEFYYELPPAEAQAKYVLSSLNYGFVDEIRFERRFGVSFGDFYGAELEHALFSGWLDHLGGCWQVRQGRFCCMHFIRSLFYPRIARRWLMA